MKASVQQQILELFRKVFQQKDLQLVPEMMTGDIPGWDSFKNVEILLACEETFAIRFRSKEIDQIRSIGDLIAMCEQKTAAQ
jgi:acyl carrier protein